MDILACIILSLTFHGHFYSDADSTVTLGRELVKNNPDSIVCWTLQAVENVQVASGEEKWTGKDFQKQITFHIPKVRTRTSLTLEIIIKNKASGNVTAKIKRKLTVHPRDNWPDLKKQLGKTKTALISGAGKLENFMKLKNPSLEILPSVTKLGNRNIGLLIVPQNTFPANAFEQETLLAQVREGMKVLILNQPEARHIWKFAVVKAPVAGKLEYRKEHDIFANIPDENIPDYFPQKGESCNWLTIGAKDPVLELLWKKPESEHSEPVDLNVLLAAKAEGKGKVLFCQIQFDDWQNDPRAGVLLKNALQYLLWNNEPTPCKSNRTKISAEEKKLLDKIKSYMEKPSININREK